jgi:hypothetical protein
MTYIVDLTLILRNLFDFTLSMTHKGKASWETLKDAINEYQGSSSDSPLRVVHDRIRSEVAERGNALEPNTLLHITKGLITKYARLDA